MRAPSAGPECDLGGTAESTGSEATLALCAVCDDPLRVGSQFHDGLYVTRQGEVFPHFVCASCFDRAASNREFHQAAAERVELLFTRSAGQA